MSEHSPHIDDRIERRWWNHWYVVLALGALLAGIILFVAGNWLVMPLVTRGSTVQVPDLYELDVAVAKQALLENGLVFINDSTDYVWSEDIPANRVVKQLPQPYTIVKTGRRVRVIISRGPQLHRIPSVRNLSPVQAKLRLEQEGFTIGRVSLVLRGTEDRSDPFVEEQEPPPGEMRPAREAVNLTISIVPEMPDLTARSLEEARQIIKLLGLRVGSVTYQQNDELLFRSVVSQSIAPGARIRAGDRVDLVLSHL